MTNEDFAARVVQMQGTLYRVTCAMLRDHADREDAVQSAVERQSCPIGAVHHPKRRSLYTPRCRHHAQQDYLAV